MTCTSHPTGRNGLIWLSRASALWTLAALLLVSTPGAWGQETPFGAPDAPPAAATDEEAEKVSEFDKLAAAEQDSLVRAVLEVKPTTPAEWIHDVRTLLNLKRFVFAKEYLKQFLDVKPNDAELAAIQARYGTALFLRLASTPQLQPEGAAVADAVMKAAGDRLQNAARLTAWVDRLNDPDPALRRSALSELVKAGSAAALPMIAVLGDGSRDEEHAAVRAALVALGNEAVEPLKATLASPNAAQRIQAIGLLGKIKALPAVPLVLRAALGTGQEAAEAAAANNMLRDVLGDVPSREEAIRFLSGRLQHFLSGSAPGPVDPDDQVDVWIWDTSQQIPRRQRLAADDASFQAAAQTAEQLHAIDPENVSFQQMYLATALEAAKRLNGYSRPLTDEAGSVVQEAMAGSVELLEQVLQLAFKERMPGAAVAVIDLLGETKNAELLRSENGQLRLLAQALRSPLPRVKFAAARAVMNIDPTHPYPGSSYLRDVLGYLSAGGGERRVLIGHPRVDEAQQLAGFFNVLGFAADSQQTGRQLALQAFTSPDYSLVLIHDAIDRPRYRELVQILRRDPRTADLPIGLLVRDVNQEAAQAFANADPRTLALAPPQTLEDVALDTRRLLATAGREQVLPDERMRQALFALDALAQLAAQPEKYGFYELLPLDERIEQALSTPALAAKAATVLGLIGTPRAQRALVALASSQMQPLADRQAAAAAFRTAVARRGLLLTRDQLLRQYEIYNSSEVFDRDTQQVLASLLDAIEAPSQASDAARADDQHE